MKKILSMILVAILAVTAFATVASAAEDQPLGDLSGKSTGWWLHTFDEGKCVEVVFTANGGFNGFATFIFASADPAAPVNVILLDGEGNELETVLHTAQGDNDYTIMFSKAYPAGNYSIKFVAAESNAGHWVLASCNAIEGGATVVQHTSNTNGNTLAAPHIKLLGADVEEGGEAGGDAGEDAPETADAAVVVIAMVAAVALAGAVVCKKANA